MHRPTRRAAWAFFFGPAFTPSINHVEPPRAAVAEAVTRKETGPPTDEVPRQTAVEMRGGPNVRRADSRAKSSRPSPAALRRERPRETEIRLPPIPRAEFPSFS